MKKAQKYDFQKVEKKWQKIWEKEGIYKAEQKSIRSTGSGLKKKFYALVEFPYPSGEGLHVGHIKGQTAVDVFSRFKRMQGYNVLNPMGYDAFGLPAENFAIKNKKHPSTFTQKNINTFISQQKGFGPSFNWERKIDTTDPQYYKWTQWIFLQLFKAGFAYEKEAPINWCPKDKTGLANEEVINGRCERCDTPVEKKNMRQWFLKITAYADKLIKDLDEVNWPEYIKTGQKNWIGRSEGAMIKFEVKSQKSKVKSFIEVFTTRPDTLFGATYMVLAPEHEIISNLKSQISNLKEVENYIEKAKKKTDEERIAEKGDKTGVELKGIKAINPANKKEIPIFVADYVLASYGTGAIMAVPAHDERDYAFAKKYKLSITKVIVQGTASTNRSTQKYCYTGEGILINSQKFNGLDSEKAKWEITKFVGGKKQNQYRLRDWLFSRQRYWGEPIPIIKCQKCGNVPLKEKDLPLLLPNVKNYKPTGTGESPLASVSKWVNVKCPICGEPAKRETNTMPQWAGSSWYFLRYPDPKNKKEFCSNSALKYFMPVDIYFGGAEHTTVHLLYSRFWMKALYDLGHVPAKEPFLRRVQHGLILGSDNRKMSKRWGNVVNPTDVIKAFGADVMRVYIMFMGPYGDYAAWSVSGIMGIKRFLDRVVDLRGRVSAKSKADKKTLTLLHQTILKVTEDIESVSYHTAISKLMVLANHLGALKKIPFDVWENYLKLLAPFAPHLSEELWQQFFGNSKSQAPNSKQIQNPKSQKRNKTFHSIHQEKWPVYDKKLIKEDEFELVIQINGKMRDKVSVPADASQKEAERIVLSRDKIKNLTGSKKPRKIIFIPNRLMNVVLNSNE
ncbi:leucine--tRNA ligase [Candidatus Wolfebacteria bacterium]|nr:leucine--tRNA ligase [Candidatus Wolfebacteria bacterium]